MIVKWKDLKVYVTGWEPNAPEHCELCGAQGQSTGGLRPFGPNKEYICFDCAQKDQFQTATQMHEAMKDCDFVFTVGTDLDLNMTEEDLFKLIDEAVSSQTIPVSDQYQPPEA